MDEADTGSTEQMHLNEELKDAEAAVSVLRANVTVFERKQALTLSCLQHDLTAILIDPICNHKLQARSAVPLHLDYNLAFKTLGKYCKNNSTRAFEAAVKELESAEAELEQLRQKNGPVTPAALISDIGRDWSPPSPSLPRAVVPDKRRWADMDSDAAGSSDADPNSEDPDRNARLHQARLRKLARTDEFSLPEKPRLLIQLKHEEPLCTPQRKPIKVEPAALESAVDDLINSCSDQQVKHKPKCGDLLRSTPHSSHKYQIDGAPIQLEEGPEFGEITELNDSGVAIDYEFSVCINDHSALRTLSRQGPAITWQLTSFETEAGHFRHGLRSRSLTISSSSPSVTIRQAQSIKVSFDVDYIERMYWSREKLSMVIIRHVKVGQRPEWVDLQFPSYGALLSCSTVFETSKVDLFPDRPRKALDRAIKRCIKVKTKESGRGKWICQ